MPKRGRSTRKKTHPERSSPTTGVTAYSTLLVLYRSRKNARSDAVPMLSSGFVAVGSTKTPNRSVSGFRFHVTASVVRPATGEHGDAATRPLGIHSTHAQITRSDRPTPARRNADFDVDVSKVFARTRVSPDGKNAAHSEFGSTRTYPRPNVADAGASHVAVRMVFEPSPFAFAQTNTRVGARKRCTRRVARFARLTKTVLSGVAGTPSTVKNGKRSLRYSESQRGSMPFRNGVPSKRSRYSKPFNQTARLRGKTPFGRCLSFSNYRAKRRGTVVNAEWPSVKCTPKRESAGHSSGQIQR